MWCFSADLFNLFAWGAGGQTNSVQKMTWGNESSHVLLGKEEISLMPFLIEYLSNESFTCLHLWHRLSTLRNLFLYRYHIHAHFNFKKLEASLMPINKGLLSGVSCCHGSKWTTTIHVNTHHCPASWTHSSDSSGTSRQKAQVSMPENGDCAWLTNTSFSL